MRHSRTPMTSSSRFLTLLPMVTGALPFVVNTYGQSAMRGIAAMLYQPAKHPAQSAQHRPSPRFGWAVTAALQTGRATLARLGDNGVDVMPVDRCQRLVGPALR